MVALLLLACAEPVKPGVPAAPAAPTEAPLEFHLTDPAHARLFRDLELHAVIATTGWRHLPYRRLGNFVEARWCSPSVRGPACDGGAVVNDREPGTAWRQLSTLAYDSEWPACFGVVYAAGDVPAEGWGATVFLAVNGRGVVGEGFGFSFLEVVGGQRVHDVHGGGWGIEVGARTFTAPVTDPVAEALALVESPDNFAATVSMRQNALAAQVKAAHEAGKLTVWQEGPYKGGGIPPERTEVAATPEESARLAAEAEAKLIADRDLLLSHAAELHGKLAALLPESVLAP